MPLSSLGTAEHSIEVRQFLSHDLGELELRLVCGEAGLGRRIDTPRVQKPGLAIAGYYEYIKAGRVQILGESELGYVRTLSPAVRRDRWQTICSMGVPCFVVTKGQTPGAELVEECIAQEIPLFVSTGMSSQVINKFIFYLEEVLAPSVTVHGVLVDILGMGVLLLGRSGIGKSECAIDLIYRGHRLIADDMVVVKKYPIDILVGMSNDLIKHHMELRGLGIINVKHLFGVAAIRDKKPIDLVIQLEKWDEEKEYDRLGVREDNYLILGVPRPFVRMPVTAGRNLSILIEIAARNQLLKLQGYFSAHEFAKRIDEEIGKRTEPQIR